VFFIHHQGRGGLGRALLRGNGVYKTARGLRTESELQMGNEIYLI